MDYNFKLKPSISVITDPVVIAQSWKKSNRYIRYSNWYSDTLELDLSALKLNQLISTWQKEMRKSNYSNSLARVVWAPKNQDWIYQEKYWGPKPDNESNKRNQKLRPLAHIPINEQVITTALMISLANIVETYQGNPASNIQDEFGCLSYGNRLDCDWLLDGGKQVAKFKWGNSNIYRKYFEDYKMFLNRPIKIMEKALKRITIDQDVYLISLDLKSFFTKISIPGLVNALKIIINDNSNNEEVDEEYYELVESFLYWDWNNDDKNAYSDISDLDRVGLPQGLVSSGFFSNAYMAIFDRKIEKYIKSKQEITGEIFIEDYIRYVDDIRIVVRAPKVTDKINVLNKVLDFMSQQLYIYLQQDLEVFDEKATLEFNMDKKELYTYNEVSSESTMSSTLNHIQKNMSGPFNLEILQQTTADLMRVFDNVNITNNNSDVTLSPYKLNKLYKNRADVRDDTIKRFVSSRLLKNLDSKRLMVSAKKKAEENEYISRKHSDVTEQDLLNNDYEKAAKMLIGGWTHNISLTLLLKHALQIYPERNIVTGIFNDLKYKHDETISEKQTDQKLAIYYVYAELFKHAAIHLGYYGHLSLDNFRQLHIELKNLSKSLQSHEIPWYLKQQIALFFLSIENFNNGIYKIPELENYRHLQLLGQNKWMSDPNAKKIKIDDLVFALLMNQISWKEDSFTEWLSNNFTNFVKKQKIITNNDKEILNVIADQYPISITNIFRELEVENSKSKLKVYIENKYNYLNPKYKDVEFKLIDNQKIDLFKIINSPNNPFKQENATLLLAIELIKELESSKNPPHYSLLGIQVSSPNWKEINNPLKARLQVKFKKTKEEFDYPIWIKNGIEKGLYFLGATIRSAMTGFSDFTAHTFLNRSDLSTYKGINSSTYIRKFSLINKGIAFNNNEFPITPWISELLFKLLQWPGVELRDIKIHFTQQVPTFDELKKIMKKRFQYQAEIYGVASDTPMYIVPSHKKSDSHETTIKIATVQSLLPQKKDFDVKNPLNWSEEFRKKHRRHLADLTKLVSEKIEATRSVYDDASSYNIDLIVFPELSIHHDDLEYLRRLSDKTKAHIFAGLTFISDENTNSIVNQALWLIRDETSTGRDFRYYYQGKQNMTSNEERMKITSKRPYQLLIEIPKHNHSYLVSGSICYDATDMRITSDLRDLSDLYVISAYNQDVNTFDKMAAYLNYHMYQPVVLVNTGNFGGSTVQAPFLESYKRTLAHVHGGEQIAISLFEIDPSPFKKPKSSKVKSSVMDLKSPPATYDGRGIIPN